MGLDFTADTVAEARAAITQARAEGRIGATTVESTTGAVRVDGAVMGTQIDPAVFRQFMAEERTAGRNVADLAAVETQLAARQAAAAVQNGTTVANRPVVPGTVVGTSSAGFGTMLQNTDGTRGALTSDTPVNIIQGQNGSLTAQVPSRGNAAVVDQILTVTMAGANGAAPTTVRLQADSVGTLTPVKAATTPQGQDNGEVQRC